MSDSIPLSGDRQDTPQSNPLTHKQLELLRKIAAHPVLPSAKIYKDLAILEAAGYVWAVDIIYVEYGITATGRALLAAQRSDGEVGR